MKEFFDNLKRGFGLMAIIALAFAPLVARAQAIVIPDTPEQATSLLPALISAISEGKWIIVGAILVLILTLVFRQYVLPKLSVGTGVLPWVSVAISAVLGIAAAAIGGISVSEAAYGILITGGVAGQLWSLGGKEITKLIAKAFGKELAE